MTISLPIETASFVEAQFEGDNVGTLRLYILLCCNPKDVTSDLFYYLLIAELESKISLDVQIAGTVITKDSMDVGILEATLVLSNGPSTHELLSSAGEELSLPVMN